MKPGQYYMCLCLSLGVGLGVTLFPVLPTSTLMTFNHHLTPETLVFESDSDTSLTRPRLATSLLQPPASLACFGDLGSFLLSSYWTWTCRWWDVTVIRRHRRYRIGRG